MATDKIFKFRFVIFVRGRVNCREHCVNGPYRGEIGRREIGSKIKVVYQEKLRGAMDDVKSI
ncbi:MAG: hypothetical protein HC902_02170 [Calothrix sp. SM1_5_4]|nr:hypothetical protein [Calothrix sp. SM1_5_4]